MQGNVLIFIAVFTLYKASLVGASTGLLAPKAAVSELLKVANNVHFLFIPLIAVFTLYKTSMVCSGLSPATPLHFFHRLVNDPHITHIATAPCSSMTKRAIT